MSLLDIVRALRQHLAVVALLLLATAAAAYGVYSQIPVYYQSNASMVVLLPNLERLENDSLVPVNPWAGLGAQSSQVAASALASIAGSENFQAGLEDRGVTSDISVEVASLYGGGVVLTLGAVNAQDTAAQGDLAVVSEQLSAALRTKQLDAGAPKDTLLTATDLTAATAPTTLATSALKLVGVTVLIGLVVIVAVILLLEALRGRVRRPEQTDTAAGGSEPDRRGKHQGDIGADTGTDNDGDIGADIGSNTAEDNNPEGSVTDADDWLDVDLWAQGQPLATPSR